MAVATSIATVSPKRAASSTNQLTMAASPCPNRLRSVWPISSVIAAIARVCSANTDKAAVLPDEQMRFH